MKKYKIASLLLISCALIISCRSKQQFVEENKVMYAENIPLGSALIACRIVELFNDGNNYFAEIKIDTVYGYGASAPPIAEGSVLRVNLNTDQYRTFERRIKLDNENLNIEIYKPQVGMGLESKNVWNVNKIFMK